MLPNRTPAERQHSTPLRRLERLIARAELQIERSDDPEVIAAIRRATAELVAAADRTPVICPVCRHRHTIRDECCTLCGWRTVKAG